MDLDPTLLARAQFAANISFHILFPSITIALGWILLYFRLRYTRSGEAHWESAYYFWVKVFALTFALGVVSGITMSFQFGTNWPGFMDRAGNIAGPLLGYEVLTAFFLEASFLGIMLFGRQRVSNRVHLMATSLVAIGTTLSAFWIIALNSWMQTPAGYVLENGEFFVDSWAEIIFSPSFPYRFAHVMLASFLTASFLIAGLSAWQLRHKVNTRAATAALRTGVVVAALFIPLQIFVGDLHGLNTLEHQPEKIAAMEAVWETERGAAFTVIGWPDEETATTRFAITIPKAASLVLTHSLDGEVQGLADFDGDHPPVAPVFFAFRIMLAVGGLMLLASWWGGWSLWRRGQLGQLQLVLFSAMTFSGWVATVAGWYVSEVGRQPWLVHGVLRTAEAVAEHPPLILGSTLIGYLCLYAFLLTAYIRTLYHMADRPAPEPFRDSSSEPPVGGRAPLGGLG